MYGKERDETSQRKMAKLLALRRGTNRNKIVEEDMIEELNQGAPCLVGKLHSKRIIRKTVIQTTMNKIWKLSQSCTFHVISENLFLLQFSSVEDKNKVLKGTPWLFDVYLFSLRLMDGHTPPSQIDFTKENFLL